MNTTCAHTHASYARWRSQVFKRLISDADPGTAPRLPFLYPTSLCRRQFHASPNRPRDVKKDFRRTARYKAKQTETESSQPTASKAWIPFTEANLEGLKSLVEDLTKLANEAKVKQNAEEDDILFEKGSIMYYRQKTNQPESPLERRLPWQRPPKLRVEEGEIDETLRDNVWALILASAVRFDRATKARLPRALMNSWGVMSNPKDQQDYLLPIELSDLEALKQQLRSPVDHTQLESESESDRQQPSSVEAPHPIDGQRLQIASSRLLIQAMSEQFILLKPQRGTSTPVRKIDSRKINVALIPHRWRMKQSEAEAFAKTRSRFNEILQREPDEDEPNVEHQAKLDKLQWKLDIADRMEKLMQERILLVLDAVGKDNASRRAIGDKRVFAMPLPEDGRFQLDASGRLVTTPSDQNGVSPPDWLHGAIFLFVGNPASYRQTVEHWHQQASINPLDSASQLDHLPPSDLIPPTIAISDRYRLPLFNLESLFGHDNAHKVTSIMQQHQIFDFKPWQSGAVGSRPEDLGLGLETDAAANSSVAAGEQVLDAIVRPGSVAASSASASSRPQSEAVSSLVGSRADGNPYLILIKPRAQHSGLLVREVWQLWRFLGGRSGLDLS